MEGNDTRVKELRELLRSSCEKQSHDVEDKYYRLKPKAFSNVGGVAYYSSSS